MLSKGMFGWSPPHIQPLTPVSEVSEPPESPSPYLDTGADPVNVDDDLPAEEMEDFDPSPAAVSFFRLFDHGNMVDWFLMFMGSVSAMTHGLSLPIYLHIFGKIMNIFGLGNAGHKHYQDDVIREFHKQALYILYIAVAVLLAGWIEVSCWMYTAERQSSIIRSKCIHVLLHQDMCFFDTYGTSDEIVAQVSEDVLFIQYTLSDKVGHYIHNMAIFLGGLVVGFLNSWQIALLTLATGPLIVAAGGASNVFLHRLAEKVQDAYSDAASIAEQAITYVRTLYAFANETLAKYLYANALQTTLKYGVQISLVQGVGLGFIYGLAICSCGLQLFYGRSLVANSKASGGDIIVAVFAVILSGLGLNQAATNFLAFEQSRVAAYRLYDMIKRGSKNDQEGKTLPNVQGNLELRNVYFSYPSRPDIPVLSGLYLSLPAKRTMALVGTSGSGRSSIISLIERFYDPTLGEVLLDGENLKALSLEWLRSQIGLVGPEPALLATSIRENILYGRTPGSADEVEEAAKIAHAHAFISSLPNGYETQIGDKQLVLTEELKLKIAIARAVLKNPLILLLDEATSNLDTQTERLVQQALDILILGRSTMIVAHRLSSIRTADCIAVIEEGRLVEMGSHDELLSIEGSYAELLRIEESANRAERIRSCKEAIVIQSQPENTTAYLLKSASMNGMHIIEMCSLHGSPHLLSPSEEKLESGRRSVLEKVPSVKRQDSLELALASLPKLDLRSFPRYSSNQSDPESPVSPLLTSDPKNERSHSKTFNRSISHLIELDSRPKPSDQTSLMEPSLFRLAKLSSPEWLYACLGGTGAALFGSFNPFLALIVFQVTEKYYQKHDKHNKHEINKWCLVLMAMGILTILVNFLQHFYFGIMGEKMTERIRRMMFSAILRNEISWFDKEENDPESLSMRLANDATFARAAFSNRLSILIQDATAIFVTIAVAMVVKWHMALVALCTIPFLVISAVFQRKWVMGFSGDIKTVHKKPILVVEDAVRDIYTVVSFSAGDMVLNLYKEQLREVERLSFIHGQWRGLQFGMSQFLLFGCNAFILWFGSILFQNGQSNLSDGLEVFFVFSFATFALAEPFGLAPYILKRTSSLGSVFGIIDRKPNIDPDDPAGLRLPNIYGTIELKDIEFSYPARPDMLVLKNLDLKVTGGQTMAIVGTSGSGKSTIISLVERFYDPQFGQVMLDGKDIRTLDLRWLRAHMGLVQQEPLLFSTTIRENIIYAKRCATESEMKEAARIANAHHFISSLPHGYDTHVGMRGLEFTAGQKQRIAIARVILKNAPILLLDEASIAIESESSRVVQEALDTLIMGNKTTIIIAHQVAILKRVDVIAVLHDGHIAEEGTHDNLIEKGGIYARLMQQHMNKPLRQHVS